MDSTQFKEFMKQQQQLTEIVRLLAAQQSLSPTKSNVNDDSTSKKIRNFANDKFNPDTTSVNEFIEYFEAKCNIYGSEYKEIQKDLFVTCLPPDIFHKIKTSFMNTFEQRTYEELKAKLCSFYSKKTTRYKALRFLELH